LALATEDYTWPLEEGSIMTAAASIGAIDRDTARPTICFDEGFSVP
jgi:hypothetical protein